ncbi:UNVERIFIED_CONTAM: hypothetical protein FKN15_031623 [Acipenser sinensis]
MAPELSDPDGVTSQQDNDKTVSVSNTIRLAVSRRDDGALVTCEATHPALRGQRKITQHALNVHYPGAIVEAQRYVPYSIIGGVLAMLVFGVICVLIVTIWCSVRQKGSYLTHEASGLDEHGEVQEAFEEKQSDKLKSEKLATAFQLLIDQHMSPAKF